MRSSSRARSLATAQLATAAALLAVAAPAHADGDLTVRFVAVRKGDATIFRGPCGATGVLDVASKSPVLAALKQSATRHLDWIAVSHYDADHLQGVEPLARSKGMTVRTVYDRGPATDNTKKTYKSYEAWLSGGRPRRVTRRTGSSFGLCRGAERVDFHVVSAASGSVAVGGLRVRSENDRGLCLKITYLRFAMAACGDANGVTENNRVDLESAVAPRIGRVDLVKVDHHGAIYSSNERYVSTLAPAVAVISVGNTGQYGHPDPAVVRRWDAVSEVFQTGVHGDVVASTDGATSLDVFTTDSGVARGYALRDPPAHEEAESGDPLPWILVAALGLLAAGAMVGLLMTRRDSRSEAASGSASAAHGLVPVVAFIDGLRAQSAPRSALDVPRDELARRWEPARDALVAIAAERSSGAGREAYALLTTLTSLAHDPSAYSTRQPDVDRELQNLVTEIRRRRPFRRLGS